MSLLDRDSGLPLPSSSNDINAAHDHNQDDILIEETIHKSDIVPETMERQKDNEIDDNLKLLGVSVQDQDALEAEVMKKLDDKIKAKTQAITVKQVKKELIPVGQKLRLLIKKKRKCERELNFLSSSASTINSQQQRRISSLVNDQEDVRNETQKNFAKQKILLQRLIDCEYSYENDPEINLCKDENEDPEGDETEEASIENNENETELQKNIRLGEVTTFGSTLQTTSKRTDQSEAFKDYVKNQMNAGKRKRNTCTDSESDSGFIEVPAKKKKSKEQLSLKKSKKKQFGQKDKKIEVMTLDDESEEDDVEIVSKNVQPQDDVPIETGDGDSDWKPSGSDDENKPLIKKKTTKVKRRQRKMSSSDEGGLKTDDSDWEGTDDEIEPTKRKRRGKTDDGDKDKYLSRISQWQKNRPDEEKELENQYEEIEGGLKVPLSLWSKLFNYQKVGVQWMFELHQQKCGGILGDEMGLGKTIQVIAFLSSLSYSQIVWRGSKWRGLGPSIIICPTTILHQWVREFHKWWPPFRVAVLHTSGSHTGSRSNLIKTMNACSGVLIMSYQSVHANRELLSSLSWHYVVLDEGHKIRNPDAQVTLAVKQLATVHRLILSGSPMQNNLKELWSLFDFIYPGKLGTLPVFLQQFSTPITQGGYACATQVQVATAFKCATVLRETINPYLLRRMKADVKNHINLPEKNEQVLFCRLTDEQRDCYRGYLDSKEIKGILEGRMKIFVGLNLLRKICNHPDLFTGGPKGFDEDEPIQEEDKFGFYKKSGKMVVIHALLKLWKKQGHRVLLFTQSRQMMAILEAYVIDQGYSYLKMDGTTAIGSRQTLIDKFNGNQDKFIFILTTRVGGLGINLTGATRVVIFDPDWNPSTDTQARERAWRIGQKKQVTIYRLMTSGTIEEKIYHRQIFKQFLINRVLKDPKQRRFFKSNDLYELFTLKETETDETETSAIFAGTGSDVRVKRKKAKKSEVEEVPVFKPESKRKTKESDGARKNVKESLNRLYKNQGGVREEKADMSENKDEPDIIEINDEETDIVEIKNNEAGIIEMKDEGSSFSLSEEMKQKLREQAKRISAQFGEKKSSNPESNKDVKSKHKKSHKHKRSKHRKDKRFEGERVPHLDKLREFKAPIQDEKEAAACSANQDNYVLTKLFSKTGVHSAIQHDAIVNGGNADYAIIEAEADQVAKEAVEALKVSRRTCLTASQGVPTWTGQNGAQKPKFGPKKKKGVGCSTSMSSSDLLAKMKTRNLLVSSVPASRSQPEDDLFQMQGRQKERTVQQRDVDLLTDIRNFIAFQAREDGKASTGELVAKFQRSLPSQQSPLFKAFLNQICDFRRDQDGRGVWKLKMELR